MTKILCLLVIALLAAQICATPADDKADLKKAAAEAAKDAKGAADTAKDAAKKVGDIAKETEKDAAEETKKAVGEGEKDAKDCEEAVEKPLKEKPTPHHHHKGIVSTTAHIIQSAADRILGFFEAVEF